MARAVKYKKPAQAHGSAAVVRKNAALANSGSDKQELSVRVSTRPNARKKMFYSGTFYKHGMKLSSSGVKVHIARSMTADLTRSVSVMVEDITMAVMGGVSHE